MNSLLKKNLNKLMHINLENIKNYFFKSNRFFLSLVILTFLSFLYLLIPYSYNNNALEIELKSQLSEKFATNFIFSNKLKYIFFPSPHFVIEDSSIIEKKNKISDIKKIKIFISLKNIFSLEKIYIKKVVLEKGQFNITKKNFSFFTNILDNNFSGSSMIIKDSSIFFRNSEDEILFINNIKKIQYYYNKKKLLNILKASSEVFNISYTMELNNDQKNKNLLLKIYSNDIQFKIKNKLDYSNDIKIGLLTHRYKNNTNTINYKLKKDSLNFSSLNKNFNKDLLYSGFVNFEPFFLNAEINTNDSFLPYLFNSNSFFKELLKTEILNNQNINMQININSKRSINKKLFMNFLLKFTIDSGLIGINQSKINWSNYANFQISESLFYAENNNLYLRGKVTLNIENLDEIYRFFNTPKKSRTILKKIEFDLKYNIDQEEMYINAIKVDNEINESLVSYLSKPISKKKLFNNKIYFKNLFNKIFQHYAG